LPLQGVFPLVRITQGAASLALGYVVLRLQRAMFGYIWVSLARVFSLTVFIRFEPFFSRRRELLFLTKRIQTETNICLDIFGFVWLELKNFKIRFL